MATNEKKMSRLAMVLIGAGVILALGLGSCRSRVKDRPDDPPIDVGDGSITFENMDGLTGYGDQVEAKNGKLKVKIFELLNETGTTTHQSVDVTGKDWTFASDNTPFALSRKNHNQGDSVTANCPGANWVVSCTKATCDPPGNIRVTPATLTITNPSSQVKFNCPANKCILRLRFK